MRAVRTLLLGAVVAGLAAIAPGAALGHAGHDHGYSTTSLRVAAKGCAVDTPTREGRLHALEAATLGDAHAAEHARSRAQGRRATCAPGGGLKRSFVAAAEARASAKRAMAVGPPQQVGQWSAPIGLPGIVAIHTTLMANGKILFFYNNPNFGDENLGRAMVWDPATQTGVRRDVPANIWCAGQTLLADGRVLVVGGNLKYRTSDAPGGAFRGLNQIWIFNPATEAWTKGPDMRHGRWYPTATRLADGRVVISSGWDETGNATNNPDIEVYTPAADGQGPGRVDVVASRDIDYYPHQFLLPDGRLLYGGPRDVDTFILNPGDWSQTDIPDLQNSRQFGYGSGVLLPGGPAGSSRVMVIGGGDEAGEGGPANSSTATTEQFDAANPAAGWSFAAPLPQPRRNVNTVILPDGNLLGVGGNTTGSYGGYVTESAMYSPATNAWTPMASQAEGRGYHGTAILLPDARVLSAGDDTDGSTGTWFNDLVEIFSPPYLFRGPRPAIAAAPRAIRWGSPFPVGTGDQVSRAVLVAPGATTHANDMNQRHVELAFSAVGGGIQAVAPPNANVAPPGPYMLFLLNAQGVPSVARFVQVGPVYDPGSGPGTIGGGGTGGPGGTGTAPVARKRAVIRFLRPKLGRGVRNVVFAVTISSNRKATLAMTAARSGPGRRKVARAKAALRPGKRVRRTFRISAPPRGRALRLRFQVSVKEPGRSTRVIRRDVLKAGSRVVLRAPKARRARR